MTGGMYEKRTGSSIKLKKGGRKKSRGAREIMSVTVGYRLIDLLPFLVYRHRYVLIGRGI